VLLMARGSRQRLGREGRTSHDEELDPRRGEMELKSLLEEHREGMVVRTGITCRHGQYPSFACGWSGVDAGRRFLQCANVENPCDFKYWIDPEFSERANRVIQDMVSMNASLSQILRHFHGQWDELLGSRQEAR